MYDNLFEEEINEKDEEKRNKITLMYWMALNDIDNRF